MTNAFEQQPTLAGDLLLLRPLQIDDFDALFSVASDPLIWQQHPENDRYKKDVFMRFFKAALDSGGAFTVLDQKTRQVIGSTRFHALEPEKSRIEIGYTFLSRNYWGNGYNKKMKSLMLRYAFRFVNEVVFVVGERNFRSRKAVERLGAREIQRLYRERDSGSYTALVYSLKKEEFR